MYFTQEDYKRIESWLSRRVVKDTDFPAADVVFPEDKVAIIQHGGNKVVTVSKLENYLSEKWMDIVNEVLADSNNDYEQLTLRYSTLLKDFTSFKATYMNAVRAMIGTTICPLNGGKVPVANLEIPYPVYCYDTKEDFPSEGEPNRLYVDSETREIFGWFDDEYGLLSSRSQGDIEIPEIPEPVFTEVNTEDLINKNGVIEFNNREVGLGGTGYTILRRDNGNSALTQDMINKKNTIYEIRYDFTVGEDIILPENCTLFFNGGRLLDGGGTLNAGFLVNLYGTGKIHCKVIGGGDYQRYVPCSYFSNLQAAIDSFPNIYMDTRCVADSLRLNAGSSLDGGGNTLVLGGSISPGCYSKVKNINILASGKFTVFTINSAYIDYTIQTDMFGLADEYVSSEGKGVCIEISDVGISSGTKINSSVIELKYSGGAKIHNCNLHDIKVYDSAESVVGIVNNASTIIEGRDGVKDITLNNISFYNASQGISLVNISNAPTGIRSINISNIKGTVDTKFALLSKAYDVNIHDLNVSCNPGAECFYEISPDFLTTSLTLESVATADGVNLVKYTDPFNKSRVAPDIEFICSNMSLLDSSALNLPKEGGVVGYGDHDLRFAPYGIYLLSYNDLVNLGVDLGDLSNPELGVDATLEVSRQGKFKMYTIKCVNTVYSDSEAVAEWLGFKVLTKYILPEVALSAGEDTISQWNEIYSI